MQKIKFLLICSVTLITNICLAQEPIGYRSDYGRVYPENPNDIVLVRNVVFTHKNMIMYCDSAIYNQKDNYFFAFNNINIYQNDTIHLTGDELHYYGNDKVGELSGKIVILEDGELTMQTDYLFLDRNDNTVRYTTGAEIWNKESTLNSKEGIYFIDAKRFNFTNNVVLTNKDAVITTDTLLYETKTEIATFNSPTNVINDDSVKIALVYGTYNTKTDEVYSTNKTQIWHKNQYMISDTVYYDKKNKNGYALGNIYVEDTAEKVFLNCDSAFLQTIDTTSTTIITGSISIKQLEKADTLYIHCDTLKIITDTNFHLKDLYALSHCKMYREDMQAAAEYAHYIASDSILYMLKRPILWAEQSQLTADTIQLLIRNKSAKEINMYPNTFIVQNSDTNTTQFFNQVSGKHLIGYFEDNKLYFANINGNTRSVYYLWDENKKNKTKKLTGINIGTSKTLDLYFNKGKLKRMSAKTNPEFYMDSYENTPEKDRVLDGFLYLEKDRPKQPSDIYIPRI